MRQYGIETGHEYDNIERWDIAKVRSLNLIITPNDAEFEKSKREEKGAVA